VRVAKSCEVVDYTSKTEIETLHCQRYFRINGQMVNFGPEYTENSWNVRYHVPVSFHYETL